MKKLAFLLAALGMTSVVYAEQPKLEVTYVGQEIYIENQSGNVDFDEFNLFNNVGLKYGDWTFGLQAGKQWAVDFGGDGIHSSNASSANRFQMDVWKKVTDDLKLGARFRGTKDYDRWYTRWDYNNGVLWSAGDVWYQSENKAETKDASRKADTLQFEVFPIGFQYGPFKAGWFVNYVKTMGTVTENVDKDDYWEHQIRTYLTLYKGEKLTVTTDARITLSADSNYKGTKKYRDFDDFGGRNRIYLGGSYQATENLSFYANYGYEFRDYKYENTNEKEYLSGNHSTENYQEITIGWKYTF